MRCRTESQGQTPWSRTRNAQTSKCLIRCRLGTTKAFFLPPYLYRSCTENKSLSFEPLATSSGGTPTDVHMFMHTLIEGEIIFRRGDVMKLERELWKFVVLNELISDELLIFNWADVLAHFDYYVHNNISDENVAA